MLLIDRKTGGAPLDRQLPENERSAVERARLFRDFLTNRPVVADAIELIEAESKRLEELGLHAVTDRLPDRLAHVQPEHVRFMTILNDQETGDIIGYLTNNTDGPALYLRDQ
jgi:hypothetical protein